MRILLSLFFLWPSLSLAQLKLATGSPLEGESQIFSQGISHKLEVNQWIKPLDEVEGIELGHFEVKFKDGTLIKAQSKSRLIFISEKEVGLLKGCVVAEINENFKISHRDLWVSSPKQAIAYICSNQSSLIAVSMSGELAFSKKDEILGKVLKEEFAVYDFADSKLSQIELLNRSQLFEIQNKPIPEQISNFEKLVPYGLSGSTVENGSEVLYEEMKQINPEISKLKFLPPPKVMKGGSRVNFSTGEIIHPDYRAYNDPSIGISFFSLIEKRETPLRPMKRTYFYQPPLEIEKVTGGVRGVFDPQRFEVIKK